MATNVMGTVILLLACHPATSWQEPKRYLLCRQDCRVLNHLPGTFQAGCQEPSGAHPRAHAGDCDSDRASERRWRELRLPGGGCCNAGRKHPRELLSPPPPHTEFLFSISSSQSTGPSRGPRAPSRSHTAWTSVTPDSGDQQAHLWAPGGAAPARVRGVRRRPQHCRRREEAQEVGSC